MTEEEPISEDSAIYEDLDEVAHVYNLLDETRKDHQQFGKAHKFSNTSPHIVLIAFLSTLAKEA